MERIPFDTVAVQVELLYQKPIDETDDEAIANHVEFIAAFIRGTGWSEEEFFDRWMTDKEVS
jgi:hypothetical protein